MLEGRRVWQISHLPSNYDGSIPKGLLEINHNIIKYRRYLPAGPTMEGGWRHQALVQFIADPGGMRTVAVEDLVID